MFRSAEQHSQLLMDNFDFHMYSVPLLALSARVSRNVFRNLGREAGWLREMRAKFGCILDANVTDKDCKFHFVQVPEENVKTDKASECLRHLRKCPAAECLPYCSLSCCLSQA